MQARRQQETLKLYSTKEAAEALGVTRQTIARRVVAGYMHPSHGSVGERYIFTFEEIERARKHPPLMGHRGPRKRRKSAPAEHGRRLMSEQVTLVADDGQRELHVEELAGGVWLVGISQRDGGTLAEMRLREDQVWFLAGWLNAAAGFTAPTET